MAELIIDGTTIDVLLGAGDASNALSEGKEHVFAGAAGGSGKTFTGTVNVKFTRKFSYSVRKMCQMHLNLGLGLQSSANTQAFIDGISSSPIPIVGVSDADPIPDSPNLPAVPATDMNEEFTVSFSAQLTNGGRFVIGATVNMKTINIMLFDVTNGGEVCFDHPAVLTRPFTIPALEEGSDQLNDAPSDESGEEDDDGNKSYTMPIGVASIDDARVWSISEEKTYSIIDVFYADTLRTPARLRNKYVKAITSMLSEMDWKSNGTGGARSSNNHQSPVKAKLTKRIGVDLSGNFFQIVDLANLSTTRQVGGVATKIQGQSIPSVFYYGDIMYPFRPALGGRRAVFDIITDSEYWTDNGPTVGEYEGGDGGGTSLIFSWEGRTSAHPVALSAFMAGLKKK
jgi:hypothetical protein